MTIILTLIISALCFYSYFEYKSKLRIQKDLDNLIAENNNLRANRFTLLTIKNPKPYWSADKEYWVFKNKYSQYWLTEESLDESKERGIKYSGGKEIDKK